jgi:asparagine synthase (glutamine-hydrolysing)
MEGIAGLIGARDRTAVDRMLGKLYHRGPASVSVYADDNAVLGARCARNHRGSPIAAAEGVAVASDSYLFNKDFLRRTIVPGADPLISDAELFLRMYKAIGTRMFSYVDGAFVVAIVDGRRTVLARDHYGLKPLYISSGGRVKGYSSEKKSQMELGSAFRPFAPGTVLVSDEGTQKIVRQEIPWANGPLPKKAEDRLLRLIRRSVEDCAVESDGFNVLLSGGIDSSAIASVAADVVEHVHTACVGMPESEDLVMARKVADHLGTDHKERVFDLKDMLKILDEVIYHAESYDYPLIRSCIPNFMAARLFGDKNLVTLCGEGGDEVFAGYDNLVVISDDDLMRKRRNELLVSGHLTGFQRVDRMTSSSCLDGRMPIMSNEIVSFGMELGVNDLLGPKRTRSKYLLRKAFANRLPKEIVWRRKRKFSDGAGSMTVLATEAQKLVSDQEYATRKRLIGGGKVRTKEEMLYFEIFRRHFPSRSAMSSVGFTV